jgi:outer membrane receptor protein involved in Fe transport
MIKNFINSLVLLFGLVTVLILPSFGQTAGEISGVITDSSGAVLVGAKITVTNPQTNFTRDVTSNTTGNYVFPSLPPGLYNVRAEKQGFQSELRNSIELQVQQTARIDFKLNVGSVTETVEVTGGAPLLNTENATLGTVIEQKRIEDLPINGRSFISLISLSPNVTTGQTSTGGIASARSGGERGGVSLSIAGLRRVYTYFSLDGVSNTDIDWNTYAFLPSIDALQEFKVQTGVYSAEFGRQAAQVNISTKSGTNNYHGTVFEFLRNNKLDARPFGFTTKVPISAPFKWNQYGFTLGGPVQIPKLFNGKDRLFFMSNYEGFKLRAQSQQTFSLPSAAMRTGNFSELLPGTPIKDPLNNNLPFPGNIIPTQRLNPISVGLLEFLPIPNIPSAGLVNNHLALLNNTTNKDQFSQRIDFVESTKSSWFGRFSWQDDDSFAAGLKQNGKGVGDRVKQIAISNTRIFSPTLVNEFRAGYLGFHNSNLSELAFQRDVVGELKMPLYLDPPAIAWGIPNVTIVGFTGGGTSGGTFGDSIQAPWVANDHTFQFIDGLSWTRGAHALKFGAEIRRDRYNENGNQNPRGSFTFNASTTGYGFGDYMLGYIANDSDIGALAAAQLRATSQAYYINDSWKLRPNLTIEAGLRYEYTPPWSSRGDNLANVIIPQLLIAPGPGPQPYMARDCAAYGQKDFYYPESPIIRVDQALLPQCNSTFGGTSLVRDDRNDFAPRLGIAWSPTQKWTVRAAVGVFYVQDETNTYFDMARNPIGRSSDVADVTHNLTWQHPFTISAGSNKCGVPVPPFVCITNPLGFSNDPDRRTPYIYQYELNLQRQLDKSTVLEIGYLGSQGHALQGAMLFGGAVPSATGTILSRNPYPAFSTIQQTKGNVHSNYESGSLKLTRRLSSGLSFLAGYTFSKSLDSQSAIGSENGVAPRQPQNGWCRACEYGLSDFDTRHRFVASVLYELPVGKGKRFLNHGIASTLLGGWQLNSIITKSSGFPVTILDGTNQSNSNLNLDRPNVVAGVSPTLDNPTTAQWFNIAAFKLQPFGSFGNTQRNIVIGPGIASWDFSTLKNFNFTERAYVQFRFECFNCANHPNFADPGERLSYNKIDSNGFAIPGTGTFGAITATRNGIDMRQLQFSLKLIF